LACQQDLAFELLSAFAGQDGWLAVTSLMRVLDANRM
jgi:hypothetical protein